MQNEIKEEKSEINNEKQPTENTSKDEQPKEEKPLENNPISKSDEKVGNKEYTRAKTKEISDKENKQNNNNKNNNLLEKEIYEEYGSDNSALSNSDISDNETDSIKARTSSNKKMDLTNFYKQSRQYFIMNSGGAPIYSRYGDEIINNSLFATFSAIITKFTVFNGGDSENLNYIKNEYSLIVFIKKGKLFLIAVSN